MRAMQVFGWTLIVAAVLTHFSFCEWEERGGNSQIVFFIHAREQFRGDITRYSNNPRYNLPCAGILGLVVPVILGGGGIALLCHDSKTGNKPQGGRQPGGD